MARLCHLPPTSERIRAWKIVNTAPLIQPYNYLSHIILRNQSTGNRMKGKKEK